MHILILFTVGAILLYSVILPVIFTVFWTPDVWGADEIAVLGIVMVFCSLIGWHLLSRIIPKRMYVRKMMAIHGTFIATGLVLAFAAFVHRLNG
ncbi:MAG: hypothetical protein AAB473_00575 [Patescibacteria group bacterium]